MLWEEMTATEFEEARIKSNSTCIIPFGVVEKHGTHLPLNTDMIIGREIAMEASKIEPFVVFPYYYFGQIAEARHVPGTISIRQESIYSLLEEVCHEISRNGFKKIVLVNSHGGNTLFIKYFIQNMLYERKDYVVYDYSPLFNPENLPKIYEALGSEDYGPHGGNMETALMMAIRPDLVKMDHIEKEGLKNYGKLNHLGNIFTGIWWYADHPTHFAGDPSLATVEMGRKLLNMAAKDLARAIKIIKEDDETKRLQDEFYTKSQTQK